MFETLEWLQVKQSDLNLDVMYSHHYSEIQTECFAGIKVAE